MKPYLRLAVILAFFGLVLSHQTIACGPGNPLEVQLDLAKSVVIGKITAIEPITDKMVCSTGVEMGRATIAVSEVLKGPATDKVRATCIANISKDYGGCAVLHSNKVGDSGIYIIDENGSLLDEYGQRMVCEPNGGSLPDSYRPEVEKILHKLASRQWSEPVNGLCAWADVVQSTNYPSLVIVVVKNVSTEDIFVPVQGDSVTLSDLVTSGNTANFCPFPSKEHKYDASNPLSCRKLSPGQIDYFPVQTVNQPCNQTFASGTYSLNATVQNSRVDGQLEYLKLVTAWTGKLSAPPVQFVVKAKTGK